MNIRRSTVAYFFRRSSGKLSIVHLQLALLLILSLLLNIGFDRAREWRRLAEQEQLTTYMQGWSGLGWYVWPLSAPLMLWMIRRYPLGRGWQAARNLAWVLGCSVLLYLLVVNLRYLLEITPNLWLANDKGLPIDRRNYFYNTFRLWPLDVLTYCGFFAVSFSLDYYFKYQQRAEEAAGLQLRTAQLESKLARAELAALRGQLQPHFLFNSFNALASLVRQRKNDDAVEVIAQLSALLRLAIEHTGFKETPLEQELEFIRRYLAIEHVRFAEKLRVEYDIEPATLGVLLPNIILQPLVENAVKHGISRRTTPGWIRLRAARVNGRLHVAIRDDGADDAPADSPPVAGRRSGVGLANTRARLTNLYGADFRLEIAPHPEGGTIVTLDLPWRQAPVTPASP